MSGKTEKYWGSGMEKWPFRLGGSLSHKRSKQENKWNLDCQNRCGYCSGGTEGSQMWAPHSRHWGMAVRIDVGTAQQALRADCQNRCGRCAGGSGCILEWASGAPKKCYLQLDFWESRTAREIFQEEQIRLWPICYFLSLWSLLGLLTKIKCKSHIEFRNFTLEMCSCHI